MTDNASAVSRPMHLVQDTTEGDPPESLFFERRQQRRRSVGGHVTAMITGPGAAEAVARRICSLQLSDMSPSGVGAMVQEPLPIGATVTIFCPPHGPESGFDLHGTIVRCDRHGWGHRLGVRVDERMAA